MDDLAFTSMLSVDGAACARYYRMQPIADVMGVWTGLPYVFGASSAGWDAALRRLAAQARTHDAQAVIGVRLESRHLGENIHEYLAFGTAIRFTDGTDTGAQVLMSMLPMDETVSLLESDFMPTRILCAATYSRFPKTSFLTTRGRNIELAGATRALSGTRRAVRDAIQHRATKLGCFGVVGMYFESDVGDAPYNDYELQVNTWGFAQGVNRVVRGRNAPRTIDLTPTPVVSLADGDRKDAP
ncbi:heavy metal-binding domain-containing protein [Tsukamurella soli]|uniref:Uncharacterized protein n=1 Tax=Tsukamurella soli TaxID=644556 RepID=A0ABP8J1T4_9ACTN